MSSASARRTWSRAAATLALGPLLSPDAEHGTALVGDLTAFVTSKCMAFRRGYSCGDMKSPQLTAEKRCHARGGETV
jgi:hypothetical protein